MKKKSFGKNTKDQKATIYSFKNNNGMMMEVSDFGATLCSLFVIGQNGRRYDVVLGYDDPIDYEGPSGTGFGATIGRNGNRINRATFSLNGKVYKLDKNDNGNNLHSGLDYYHYRVWDVKKITDNSITFLMDSPDGDQGYPGTLKIEVTYTLTDENELKIDYYGIPDEDTIINMTNHTYFNLNGHDAGSILNHALWVDADAYTETDEKLIPTGKIVPVEGTPMDFREKKLIGRDIKKDYQDLKFAGGYDHNWCINNHGILKKVIEVSGDVSGIEMEVYTDLPGVQIYSGNFLVNEIGKQRAVYKRHQGICFETQYYPDAINHKNFPSPICKKGEVYRTTTIYKFISKNQEYLENRVWK